MKKIVFLLFLPLILLSQGTQMYADGVTTDQNGNSFEWIKYEDQYWSIDNAEVETYRDGTPIPQVTDPTQWSNLTTGAWCYINNDSAKSKVYNWFAIAGIHDNDENTPNKEFAPEDWEVPSDAQWTILENILITNGYNYNGVTDGEFLAKAMASNEGWNDASNNTGAIGNQQQTNNTSGFNAVPTGFREPNGAFNAIGNTSSIWTSSSVDSAKSINRDLWYMRSYIQNYNTYHNYGLSVRFVSSTNPGEGDGVNSSGDIVLSGIVSAENNQIKNVADPTDAQDAVTKNYTYSKSEVDALISEIKTELGNQIDNDGDGYTEDGGDCDDSDSEINPAANEVCDNIDNNCNAEIDEGVTNPYYQDVDGDGFGLNGIDPVMTCSPPDGYVSNNQDCDDTDSAIYPGAPELSDGIDNDCDGQIDEQNEQTLVSGHEDSSTFPSEHSPNYSTVISHVNEVSQLLTPNTKITKLIIHPTESKNNVKVIPFLTDENFNVVALGEEYYFDAIEGESHEIIFNTELTSTSSFYIGCYENVFTKHKSSSCNGKYKWESGEPAIGLTINDGTSTNSSCRSTQAYGY
jgi:uncharacterized protein (TIGR02145 family)